MNSSEAAYPAALRERESALVKARRAKVVGAGELPPESVGLALSGGGIRSATFCLGVLQALARLGRLQRIDYLSTVSGGGYCGGFLGRLISRGSTPVESGVRRAEKALAARRSPELAWLRENGRYLSPNGAGDDVVTAAVILRNWLAVLAVLFSFAGAACALGVALRVWLAPGLDPGGEPLRWSPFWWGPASTLLLAVPFASAYWIVPPASKGKTVTSWASPLRGAFIVLIAAAIYYVAVSGDPAPGGAVTGNAAETVPAASGNVAETVRAIAAGVAALMSAALLLLGIYWVAAGKRGVGTAATANTPGLTRDRRVRKWLSRDLGKVLLITVALAGLALIDTLGVSLYRWLSGLGAGGLFAELWRLLGAAGVSAGGLYALVRYLVGVANRGDKERMSLPLGVLAGAAALLLAGVILISISAAVHAVVWNEVFSFGLAEESARLTSVLVLFVAATSVSVVFGQTMRFANDSSQQAFYAARLARAYFGASNPERLKQDGASRSVTEPIVGDDISLDEYAPHAHGGPLHLICTTLNETVAGESQIEHRDRKGLALTVGPAAISAGVRHHALWGAPGDPARAAADTGHIEPVTMAGEGKYRIFPPAKGGGLRAVESLPLSTWIAISGAAVAPGLGSLTSVGFSLLLGLFNVRLGYWWDSGIAPSERKAVGGWGLVGSRLGRVMSWVFPVQSYLSYEILARFHGPNRRRWYVSDGGHFENTGCYELLRRRLPFIIVCDCGCDPKFDFDDVANLVRKARTDFDAEIRFFDDEELEKIVHPLVRPHFGRPADLGQPAANGAAPGARPRPCALLARVDYGDSPVSADSAPATVILFLKPTLCGAQPEDVRQYARQHADFPHESTADQYFDEAQWEAYRKLGEVVASQIFASAETVAGRWLPHSMTKPAPRGDVGLVPDRGSDGMKAVQSRHVDEAAPSAPGGSAVEAP